MKASRYVWLRVHSTSLCARTLTVTSGSFSETVPVTVISDRAGLVMNPDAKVKMRGVQVGKVLSIESKPDGTANIHLAMDPSQLHLIPSNVNVDIESSTVLLEQLGDTEFLRMLGWHDRVVRDTAEEHRGFVVKSQGDGFMLAFPSAAFALRASLTMRDRITEGFAGLPVRIRAGLHSGEAIKHDDDFYGRTVAIAARISALALGGEVLASDLVYALARGLGTFTFGDPRTATLKGIDGTFDLHPVLG